MEIMKNGLAKAGVGVRTTDRHELFIDDDAKVLAIALSIIIDFLCFS